MQQNKVGEQKLFKLFGRFSLVILLGTSALFAESFEDFKRSQAESFQKYKDERDNEFNKYLKQQWKAYNVYKGTPLYEKPKPKKIPPAKPKPIKNVGPTVSIKVTPPPVVQESVKPKLLPKEIQKPEPQVVQKPQELAKPKEVISAPKQPEVIMTPKKEVVAPVQVVQVKPKKDVTFNFFGSELGFDIDTQLKSAKFYPQNQKGINNFFETAASSNYDNLVSEIKKTSKQLNLNDWGVYLLVTEISKHTFQNEDDANLLSWFLFNKLGYAVKVGLAKKHVVLMHYSKKIIYSTPSYTFGKKKYYVVSHYAKGRVGRLFSYQQNYPGSTKPMDLALSSLPNFVDNLQKKTLSYTKFGNKISVDYEYNKNLIDFMATYPQADYETFFNAPLDERSYASVAKGLKPYLDGKKASMAMNFVLNFVQSAFKYQRDDQQFGREKVMFAQETLFFEKSDCEDRSVLFSYLVKELFGIGVVGVKYKDHMATALYVPMQGDQVKAGSKKFVVADPTYINASIGQSMPQYKKQLPEKFIVVTKK